MKEQCSAQSVLQGAPIVWEPCFKYSTMLCEGYYDAEILCREYCDVVLLCREYRDAAILCKVYCNALQGSCKKKSPTKLILTHLRDLVGFAGSCGSLGLPAFDVIGYQSRRRSFPLELEEPAFLEDPV